MRQIILDTETTGLKPSDGHKIIELGCVEVNAMDFSKSVARNWYFNPERESDKAALEVHGLTSEFLSDKPLFKDKIDEIAEYLKDAELIIHNAEFDMSHMDNEFVLCGHRPLSEIVGKVTCTLKLARAKFPGQKNNLDALCSRLGISTNKKSSLIHHGNENADFTRTLTREHHSAIDDAEILFYVYRELIKAQDSLLEEFQGDTISTSKSSNFTLLNLKVQKASDDEIIAHQAYLNDLSKISKNEISW